MRAAALLMIGCLSAWCGACEGRAIVAVRGAAEASGASGGPAASGAAGRAGGDGPPPCVAPPDDGMCQRSEPIMTCDVRNARDLGGVPLASDGSVACGQVFRGPPLADLSVGGCGDAARLGIRTVIDLRTADERLYRPDDSCLRVNTVLAPLPVPYELSGENYLADFDTSASIAKVFHTLGDDAAYPVYFHCTYGRDRTGVVAAAVLLALGASRADILQEYTLSRATVGAFPESLESLLDEIERRGGIEAALGVAGVSAADLATLRAHAVVPAP